MHIYNKLTCVLYWLNARDGEILEKIFKQMYNNLKIWQWWTVSNTKLWPLSHNFSPSMLHYCHFYSKLLSDFNEFSHDCIFIFFLSSASSSLQHFILFLAVMYCAKVHRSFPCPKYAGVRGILCRSSALNQLQSFKSSRLRF